MDMQWPQGRKYQIFLSSASADLGAERESLIRGLFRTGRYFPIAMEHFYADSNIISMLHSYLQDSDLYLLLMKDSAGSPIDREDDGANVQELEKLMEEDPRLREEICRMVANFAAEAPDGKFSLKDLTFTQVEYAMAGAMGLHRLGFVYDSGRDREATLARRRCRISGSDDAIAYGSWQNESQMVSLITETLNNHIARYPDSIRCWTRADEIPLVRTSRSAGILDCSVDAGGISGKLPLRIESAERLDLLFTTGLGFTQANQTMLGNFVARGGSIRLLCCYPNYSPLQDVARAENFLFGNREKIHSEFDTVVGNLRNVRTLAENLYSDQHLTGPLGTIEVGNCGSLFRSSIVICHGADHTDWGWLNITLPPRKSREMFTIEMEQRPGDNRHVNLMSAAIEHFEDCWILSEKEGTILQVDDSLDKQMQRILKQPGTAPAETFDGRRYWLDRLRSAKFTRRTGKKVLIEVAAQHPLDGGDTPNAEFRGRLDTGIRIWHEKCAQGLEADFYVPGSVHLTADGFAEYVSLATAGCTYLREHGIPAERIHGDDWNDAPDPTRAWTGVYNSGDECYVAARHFNDPENGYGTLICICSPNQAARKTLFYLESGVLPMVYTVPAEQMFHNIVNELYQSIPYILEVDHNLQGPDSAEAKRTRRERMPNFEE